MEVQITLTALGVFIVVFVVFLLAVLFYLYPGAGKQSTIPGPNPAEAKDGNVSDLQHAGSLQQYLEQLHDEFGEVTAFWYGSQQIVSVADQSEFAPVNQVFEIPKILFSSWIPLVGEKSFLFAKDIENFQRRDMIEFKVDSNSKEKLAKIFLQYATELAQKWKKTPKGQHVPLSQHINGLATKSLCTMMFGDYFKDDSKIIKLHKCWNVCWSHIEDLLDTSENSADEMFRKNLGEVKDLISKALESRFKQHPVKSGSGVLVDGILGKSKASAITEDQLMSDAITLFTIGMHITNNVLLWVLFFLASNPDVQSRLRKELQKNKDMDIMPASLGKVKYLQQVLMESVRCGGVFSWKARQQDIDIQICGHVISKLTPVIEDVGAAMMCEKTWPDPTKFDPDRFSDKNDFNPLEYIPFGFGGSRKNPSDSLVYLLTSVATAVLIRDVEVNLEGEKSNLVPGYVAFMAKPSEEELWVTMGPKEVKVETVSQKSE